MDLAGLGPSYAGVALTLLFVGIGLAEQAWPAWHPVAPAGRRWIANVGLYACCQGLSLALLPWLTVAAMATFVFVPRPGAAPDPGWAVIHVVTIVLALDLVYYLLHRLFHASATLWRLHAIHHTDLDLDVTSTLRHHPLEVVPMVAVAAMFSATIGATPGEIAGYGVLAFGVQMLAHANLNLPRRLDAALGWVIVTPAFHRTHHSRDERECHANYGEVFVFWDRLFGSGARVSPSAPAAFGVAAYLAPRFQHFGWMVLQPALRRPSGPGHSDRV